MKYNFDESLDHRYNDSIRWVQPDGRKDVLGMGTADMDFYCPPSIKDVTKKISLDNSFNYRFKSDSYFQSVINFYKRRYDLKVDKSWLSNIPGTVATVKIALESFSRPGDYILMQTPHFVPLELAVTASNRKFLGNQMILKDGRYELDLDDFERKIKEYRPSIFLMVNPHNPTGRVFTREELGEIVDICKKHDVLIVSDEVHSLILYNGHKHIPILGVSEEARDIAIQIVSMSKGFNLASLPHTIIAIANPELRSRWDSVSSPYSFGYASNIFTIGAVTSLLRGEADDWLEEVTTYLENNKNKIFKSIEENQLPLTPINPEAGYLLWIDCRDSGLNLEKLDEVFLDRAGISINNGLIHGEKGKGFIRMNFAVTKNTLESALSRMAKMFNHGNNLDEKTY